MRFVVTAVSLTAIATAAPTQFHNEGAFSAPNADFKAAAAGRSHGGPMHTGTMHNGTMPHNVCFNGTHLLNSTGHHVQHLRLNSTHPHGVHLNGTHLNHTMPCFPHFFNSTGFSNHTGHGPAAHLAPRAVPSHGPEPHGPLMGGAAMNETGHLPPHNGTMAPQNHTEPGHGPEHHMTARAEPTHSLPSHTEPTGTPPTGTPPTGAKPSDIPAPINGTEYLPPHNGTMPSMNHTAPEHGPEHQARAEPTHSLPSHPEPTGTPPSGTPPTGARPSDVPAPMNGTEHLPPHNGTAPPAMNHTGPEHHMSARAEPTHSLPAHTMPSGTPPAGSKPSDIPAPMNGTEHLPPHNGTMPPPAMNHTGPEHHMTARAEPSHSLPSHGPEPTGLLMNDTEMHIPPHNGTEVPMNGTLPSHGFTGTAPGPIPSESRPAHQ